MGTIRRRPRRDGTTGYTAQVKVWREGRVTFTKAATFDREATARAWMARTEKALAQPGAVEAARKPKGNLGDMIDRYVEAHRKDMGRTKAQVLTSIKGMEIAERAMAEITSADLVDFARDLGGTRQPQTVLNYLSHLGSVFAVARSAWGLDVDRAVMKDALETAKHFGLVTKSAQRSRRPTLAELDKLMVHFIDRTERRRALPMDRIVAFAIYSTRRQEEIVRILRADMEPGRVLVRDMKNPGEKAGNHVWCVLVPEAEAIVEAMPKSDDRLFPYTTDAISAAFTRACKLLEIKDLHFHDLRHEGVSRLFEMGWTIPRAAEVSGHRSWQSLQRYSHMRQTGDRFDGWKWLPRVTMPLE